MEIQTPRLRSHRNLRAYRRACALASDIFWITRRFSRQEPHTLALQLRRYARAIPDGVEKGWAKRHNTNTFQRHLSTALDACHHLTHWLNVAKACQHLTENEHATLMAHKDEVQRRIQRLQRVQQPKVSV